jgi:beta-galactosidase
VTVLVLLAAWSHAQAGEEDVSPRNYIEEENTLSAEFETPHTPWAKPYAAGPVRAVFFAPWAQGSTWAREVVEWCQRFDIDGHAACLMGGRPVGDGRPDWYGGDPEAGTNRALRLLDAGPDLIVLNQITPEALPEALRNKLAEKVSEGAGLVLVGDETSSSLSAARGITPMRDDLPEGAYYAWGEGRVASLPSRETLEYRLGWETEFDYQAQAQGRAMLWAARMAPQCGLDIEVPEAVRRGDLPADVVTVSWRDLPRRTKIRARLRRWDGESCELGTVKAGGDGSRTLSLPQVREGAYHIDCFAESAKGVENWATRPLRVVSACHVDAVELERDWAEAGEKATGVTTYSGSIPADAVCVVRLVDVHDRILAQQTLRPQDDRASFSLPIEPWMPMLLRVESVIEDSEGEVSYAYAFLRVTTRNRDQFNFVMWNIPSGDLAPYGVESLARHGVTAILSGGPPPLHLAANQLAWVPYAASFRASSHTLTAMLDPETGLLKSGCVHDPEAMGATVARVVEGVQEARKLGVFAYSLGDENAVRASCLGPHCLRAYQGYLESMYGTIDALNDEWETDYASFDAIELLTDGELPAPDAPEWFKLHYAERKTLHTTDGEGAEGEALARQVAMGDINDEMRALQQGNFARWYDRQAFQCHTYVEWCKQFQEAFLKIDPLARTGFEGTDSFSLRKLTTRSRQGGDLDRFVRDLDYYGSYEGPGNEVMRSIAPAGFPMGSWIGYTPDVEELLFKYWQQVTDRMNTVQWWRWDNLSGYHGYLAPNLAPFPATQELFDDTQIVRDGLGALIMDSEMHDDGIAMLYSMPSTHIAHFDGNQTYGKYTRDHDRWHHVLHDAGLQFRYVTDRMLRLGEFDASRYKVLILPLAFAMGPEEAEAIRRFVRDGGTVIADLRPALYDGHCKPLGTGALDDVFGIARTGNLDARPVDRVALQGEIDGQPVSMRWGNWHGRDIYPEMVVDPNVELTSGEALGEAYLIHFWTGLKAPVGIVNRYGKGRAILLNFSVYYAPVETLVPDLLAAAGVHPAVRLSDRRGTRLSGIEVSRWRNGNIELLALLGDYEGEVEVGLSGPRQVYDMKRHLDHGATEAFTTPLRPNRASFFALLPAPPSSPRLDVPSPVQRGSVVEATVHVPKAAGAHAVTIRATMPDGRDAAWLGATLVVHDEPVPVMLPMAYNDPVGVWEIQATDAYTGRTTTASVTVR